jgi:hypothetical protein
MGKIQLFEWISWRLFLIKMTLRKIFQFKSDAKDEVISLDPGSLKNGGLTNQEDTIISKFGEFYRNVDPVVFSRLDFYFVSMIIGIVLLVVVPKLSLGLLAARLLRLGGAFAVIMSLSGFILEMLNKSANPVVKEDEYKRCKRLLQFMGESARKPLSTGMMFLVLLMVFIDAAMISIVAMDYVADLPRKYALWGGVGVGLIVAIMLFFFTHEAGKALYRDTKRKELQDERHQNKDSFKKELDDLKYKLSLTSHFFLHPKRYLWMCVALVMIAGLAYAAYGARYSTQMDIILSQAETARQTLGIETDNPMLPSAVTQSQKEAGDEIANEHQELAKRATQFALIILTLVFIGIQMIGIMMGYKHAFFDDETEAAYMKVRSYELQEGFFGQSMDIVARKAATFLSYYNSALQRAAYEAGKLTDDLGSRKPLGVTDIIAIFKGQAAENKGIPTAATGSQADQQGHPFLLSTHDLVASVPQEPFISGEKAVSSPDAGTLAQSGRGSTVSGTDKLGIASNPDANAITYDAGARETTGKPSMPSEKEEDTSSANNRLLKKKKRELERKKNEFEEKLDELEENNSDPQEIERIKGEIKGLKREIRSIEDQLEE